MTNFVLSPIQKKHVSSLPPAAKNAYILELQKKHKLKQRKKKEEIQKKSKTSLSKVNSKEETKICKNLSCDKIITTPKSSFCSRCLKKKERGFSIVYRSVNHSIQKSIEINPSTNTTRTKQSKQIVTKKKKSVNWFSPHRTVRNCDKCLSESNITFEDKLECLTICDSQNIINRVRSEPTKQLHSQYDILSKLFPDFPAPMLRMLYVREEGNSKFIFKLLKKYGWLDNNYKDKILINCLHSSKAVYFRTLYYWGKLDVNSLPDIDNTIGNFYTFTHNTEKDFVLVYINTLSQLQTYKLTSPEVPIEIKQRFSLQIPIYRPKDFSYSLVPFF